MDTIEKAKQTLKRGAELSEETRAMNGIADELYEMRKKNDDTLFYLKNIAGSLDFISQYLYDISWELKKNREKNLDLSEKVEQYYSMIVLETPEQIAMFRLLSLRSALKLECLGMKRRGRSAYAIVKAELGFKGNKKSVLEQLEQKIEDIKNG